MAANGTSYIICEDLELTNLIANTTETAAGTVVGLTCEKEGSTVEGATVLICERTGFWSDVTPLCTTPTGNKDQILIIIICAVASAVALGVLCCALYMLLSNFRKERRAKQQKRDIIDSLRELSIYHAVTQDCVGMPPVVYDNINATLRGRASSSEESSQPNSPQTLTGSEAELAATEKAFIY